MRSLKPGIWTALVATAILTAGAAIGILIADDTREVDGLRSDLQDMSARAQDLAAREARVRGERDRLELRLAAREDTPVCPTPFSSTADAGLPLPFAIDYPCGWHVVVDAVSLVERPAREGMVGIVTLISQLPVGIAPSSGALADIEITDWSDDPADGADPIPPLPEWLATDRANFDPAPQEDRFEGSGGITIHQLRGTLVGEGRVTEAVVLVWTYADPLDGRKHIVRALAEQPGPGVSAALLQLARSFSLTAR